jgi:hypothetical protein
MGTVQRVQLLIAANGPFPEPLEKLAKVLGRPGSVAV